MGYRKWITCFYIAPPCYFNSERSDILWRGFLSRLPWREHSLRAKRNVLHKFQNGGQNGLDKNHFNLSYGDQVLAGSVCSADRNAKWWKAGGEWTEIRFDKWQMDKISTFVMINREREREREGIVRVNSITFRVVQFIPLKYILGKMAVAFRTVVYKPHQMLNAWR